MVLNRVRKTSCKNRDHGNSNITCVCKGGSLNCEEGNEEDRGTIRQSAFKFRRINGEKMIGGEVGNSEV